MTLSNPTRPSSLALNVMIYSFYAWGVPFGIVLIGQIVECIEGGDEDELIKPKFGFTKCWFICK